MVHDINLGGRIDSGTVIRSYSPAGVYWRQGFACPTALYVNQGDLVFSACHFDKQTHERDYYSEFDDPTIEELRLAAALMLPIGYICGVLPIYPLSNSLALTEYTDLLNADTIPRLSALLRSGLRFNDGRPWDDGLRPPSFGGRPYQFRDGTAPPDLQQRIYDAVDMSDHVLMRGIGTFMRAGMLAQHKGLFEAAHYALFISLDASFEIIKKKLLELGVASPNASDAAALMEEAFGEEMSGGNYFEDYYEDRIRTVHAASRFGSAPYAPLSHSHFFGLYYGLREVYRWIILGEHIELS